jgi:hypothetical protein
LGEAADRVGSSWLTMLTVSQVVQTSIASTQKAYDDSSGPESELVPTASAARKISVGGR